MKLLYHAHQVCGIYLFCFRAAMILASQSADIPLFRFLYVFFTLSKIPFSCKLYPNISQRRFRRDLFLPRCTTTVSAMLEKLMVGAGPMEPADTKA